MHCYAIHLVAAILCVKPLFVSCASFLDYVQMMLGFGGYIIFGQSLSILGDERGVQSMEQVSL